MSVAPLPAALCDGGPASAGGVADGSWPSGGALGSTGTAEDEAGGHGSVVGSSYSGAGKP